MILEFRKLKPSESNLYRELRLECLKLYPENFGSNYQDETKKEKLFFQPMIENQDPNTFVIGGFHNRKLIAICGFQRYDAEKTKHRARIIQLYVTPEYQKKHIASDILKSTIKEAIKIQGIEQIELGVITTNSNAEKIYQKLGFKEYGIQKDYLKIDNNYFDHKMMALNIKDYNPN